jgi:hypothetical protein
MKYYLLGESRLLVSELALDATSFGADPQALVPIGSPHWGA